MTRKKKVIIFLSVVGALYFLSVGGGLMREESDMDKAMREVKAIVGQARDDIEAEMNKPFWERLIGSLFGIEGNSFDGLKKDLPPVIKEAMPKIIGHASCTSKSPDIFCDGMRLTDALSLIRSNKVAITKIYWTFDDQIIEEKYMLCSGTVIRSDETANGINLTIQLWHPHTKTNNMNSMRIKLNNWAQTTSNQTAQALSNWIEYEQSKNDISNLLSELKIENADYIELEK